MESGPLHVQFLYQATAYLESLSEVARGRMFANIVALSVRNFSLIRTKQLRGTIRELVVGDHRLTYFIIGSTLYLARGFRKKSQKTPRAEIEYAEKMYHVINNSK